MKPHAISPISVPNPKSYKIKIALIVLLFTITVYATTWIEVPINDEIDEAVLIIKGTLDRKFTKIESIKMDYINKNNEIMYSVPESIYTTYIFNVEEVLKGKYINPKIEVKMFGGCVENICDNYSFTYNYQIGEQAVLFLHYFPNTKIFKVTQSAKTAFRFDNNNLIRKSENNDNSKNSNYKIMNKDGKVEVKAKLNLLNLKSLISEQQQ